MSGAEQFVTKEEFDSMKATVDTLRTDVLLLTKQVAGIAEDLGDLRVEVNELREDMEKRFVRLEQTVVDGNTALMSAILRLGPR